MRRQLGDGAHLALGAVAARPPVARVLEQLDLARDAAVAVRTVALEASRLVEADAGVLARLTAAVVACVVLAQSALHARRTHAHEVAAAGPAAAAPATRRRTQRAPGRRPARRTCMQQLTVSL